MSKKIKITFTSEESAIVFIRVIEKIKKDRGIISPLDFGLFGNVIEKELEDISFDETF